MRPLMLLLLVGFFAGNTGCIRPYAKQESLKSEAEPQPTCGDAGQVSMPAYCMAKCATCHRFDKNTTGPALQGMMKRAPSREWLMAYLQNEDSLIRSGDTVALRISKFSPAGPCHRFRDLNDHFLDELIRFTEQ